jgi:acyl-CoA dehydrogenase
MDFAFDPTTQELRERLLAFMDEAVYPAEPRFREEVETAADPWGTPPVIEELKARAREQGLWNLFLPAVHEHGAGLTNLQYAPLAEITGHSPWMAPEALNCSAPDTGNMELLSLFGTAEQKARWLDPLLDGRIRSAFSMTEPDVASSDATNIATRIERDGDEYVINGRKWWTSGAMSPRCELLIVMGVTDRSADRHRRQSMILVPKDTPGVHLVRSTSLFATTTGRTAGTPRSSTTTSACRPRTCSARRGRGSGSRRNASGPVASTMRCGRSGWPSARWRCCAGAPPHGRRSGGRSSTMASSSAGSPRRVCGSSRCACSCSRRPG